MGSLVTFHTAMLIEYKKQPLTLALGATIASCRPHAFRLPPLLVGGAPLFAFYKQCTARVSAFDCGDYKQTKAQKYLRFYTFLL